jgi:hypothetical protein
MNKKYSTDPEDLRFNVGSGYVTIHELPDLDDETLNMLKFTITKQVNEKVNKQKSPSYKVLCAQLDIVNSILKERE